MARFTLGSHNMLFRLDARRWAHDLDLSAVADLRGFQEAIDAGPRAALAKHAAAKGLGLYAPKMGNPIAWNPEVFEDDGRAFSEFVHRSAIADGLTRAKFNPARYVTGKGLVHKATGKRVLFLNVHPIAGGTKPEPNDFGPALNAWKNRAIERYWLAVLQITAREIRKGVYDVIILGGDWNARGTDRAEWYFPARMLQGLFRSDEIEVGLDHVVLTRHSAADVVRRWARNEGVNSDHALHFAEIRL